MAQSLSLVSLVVADYDAAIAFYVDTLGFDLVTDTYQPAQDKRWVVVRPRGAGQAGVLLAQASDDRQRAFVGDQTGGRVFLFLETDDFQRDFDSYTARGETSCARPRPNPMAPSRFLPIFMATSGT